MSQASVTIDGKEYPVRTRWLVRLLRLLLARERQPGWQPDRFPAGRMVYAWSSDGRDRMVLADATSDRIVGADEDEPITR